MRICPDQTLLLRQGVQPAQLVDLPTGYAHRFVPKVAALSQRPLWLFMDAEARHVSSWLVARPAHLDVQKKPDKREGEQSSQSSQSRALGRRLQENRESRRAI